MRWIAVSKAPKMNITHVEEGSYDLNVITAGRILRLWEREIMKKKKISASDLSKKINVQKSSISHILSGRNKPSLDFVVKLSDSFNDINIDWLINGDKSTTPTLNSDLLEKNNNSKKRVTKIVLFYDDKSFDTYEAN